MAFLSSLMKAGKTGASSVSSLRALSPFIGSAAGGAYGYATSENLDPTARLKDTMLGAAAGLGLGALATNTFWKGAWGATKGIGKSLYRNRVGLGRTALKAGKLGLTLGAQVAKGAMNHPYTALALAGSVYGISALQGMGQPGQPNNPEAMMERDRMPSTGMLEGEDSRQRWQQSTMGLVQGLHRGRHS